MTGVAVAAAVAMLVLFVLVRGRSLKIIGDLRREYSGLVSEEKRLRGECEQASILEESADAMHNQAEADVAKYQIELRDLTEQTEELEAALNKNRADEA